MAVVSLEEDWKIVVVQPDRIDQSVSDREASYTIYSYILAAEYC